MYFEIEIISMELYVYISIFKNQQRAWNDQRVSN